MRQAYLKGAATGLILGLITPVVAEEIKLVTYYPAPRGVYEELRTTGTTTLATQAGSVGIGTSNPADNLHLSESDPGTTTILTQQRYERLTSGAAAAGLGVAADYYLEDAAGISNQAARIAVAWEDATNTSEDASIRFSQMVAGTLTETMRLDDAGNVGIGTTSPEGKVDVRGDGVLMMFKEAPSGGYRGRISNEGGNGSLELASGAQTIAVRLNSNGDSWLTGGNVGIGTTTPQSKLQVVGNYIQFPTISAAPAPADCDAAAEAGRVVVYIASSATTLYVCNGGSRGWDYVVLTQ